MTAAEAMQSGTDMLATAGVDAPRVDAEWLLAHVLGCARAELALRMHASLDAAQQKEWDSLLAQRARQFDQAMPKRGSSPKPPPAGDKACTTRSFSATGGPPPATAGAKSSRILPSRNERTLRCCVLTSHYYIYIFTFLS